jgi:hypothetical protein
MRAFLVALIITLLVLPAYAQRMGGGKGGGKQNPASSAASDEQKKKNAQQEKDYKSALDRIPNKPPADPWANMR